jgi:uncharacterized protein (TIGR03067 family)
VILNERKNAHTLREMSRYWAQCRDRMHRVPRQRPSRGDRGKDDSGDETKRVIATTSTQSMARQTIEPNKIEDAPRNEGRDIMHRLAVMICAGLIFTNGLLFTFAQSAQTVQQDLQGTWTATKAERDGKAADDLVGHRLSFTGNRFQIQSKDGKLLYAGNVSVQPSAKPAAIDFELTEGALKGKSWKGIFVIKDGSLTTCDNAPNPDRARPDAFEAKRGSGYVLITFQRTNP